MSALVIADRDGTLIEDKHYLSSPDMVSVIPGVVAGVKHLEESNIDLVVATNQSGIGRGYFDRKSVVEVNNRCQRLIDPNRKVLKHFFFCKHIPEDNCACRKPLTGMIDEFLMQSGLKYSKVYVIGDRMSDLQFAVNLNALPILVLTGKGRQTYRSQEISVLSSGYLVAQHFGEAVDLILKIEQTKPKLVQD